MKKSEALEALSQGKTLVGTSRSGYPGESVEYSPRKDEVMGNPDCYPWHVIGRPDYDRMRVTELEVKG